MKISHFINSLYVGGTRSARVLNLLVSLVWIVSLTSSKLCYDYIKVPDGIREDINLFLAVALTTSVLSFSSLIAKQYRTTLKYIGLHTGSLFHAMVAVGYSIGTQNITVSSITSMMLAMWLLGAAYFDMERSCEGCDQSCDQFANR